MKKNLFIPINIYKSSLILLIAATFLMACSTARKRQPGDNLFRQQKTIQQENADYLKENMRTGNIYYQYKELLEINGWYRSEEYMNKYYNELKISRFKNIKTPEINFGQDSFIIFLNSPDPELILPGRAEAIWRIMLDDRQGNYSEPISVEYLNRSNPEVIFINKYIKTVERVFNAMIITFQQKNKNDELKKKMLVTGLLGNTELVF